MLDSRIVYISCVCSPTLTKIITTRLGYNWSFLTNFLQTLVLISDQTDPLVCWENATSGRWLINFINFIRPKRNEGNCFTLLRDIAPKTGLDYSKRKWCLKTKFSHGESWDNLSSSKSKVLKHHDSMSVHIEASNASYYSKVLDTILYHGIMLSSLRQYQTSITTMLLECENLCRKQFEYSTRCNY